MANDNRAVVTSRSWLCPRKSEREHGSFSPFGGGPSRPLFASKRSSVLTRKAEHPNALRLRRVNASKSRDMSSGFRPTPRSATRSVPRLAVVRVHRGANLHSRCDGSTSLIASMAFTTRFRVLRELHPVSEYGRKIVRDLVNNSLRPALRTSSRRAPPRRHDIVDLHGAAAVRCAATSAARAR